MKSGPCTELGFLGLCGGAVAGTFLSSRDQSVTFPSEPSTTAKVKQSPWRVFQFSAPITERTATEPFRYFKISPEAAQNTFNVLGASVAYSLGMIAPTSTYAHAAIPPRVPDEFRSFRQVIADMYREGGYQRFFRGLLPYATRNLVIAGAFVLSKNLETTSSQLIAAAAVLPAINALDVRAYNSMVHGPQKAISLKQYTYNAALHASKALALYIALLTCKTMSELNQAVYKKGDPEYSYQNPKLEIGDCVTGMFQGYLVGKTWQLSNYTHRAVQLNLEIPHSFTSSVSRTGTLTRIAPLCLCFILLTHIERTEQHVGFLKQLPGPF